MKVAVRKSGGHVVHKAQEVHRGPALLNMGHDLTGSNLQRRQVLLKRQVPVGDLPSPADHDPAVALLRAQASLDKVDADGDELRDL